jgi:hypothetical protein
MLHTPHTSPTPAMTVVGRARSGQPRTYRLARQAHRHLLAAACRRLAGALVAVLPGRLAPAA